MRRSIEMVRARVREAAIYALALLRSLSAHLKRHSFACLLHQKRARAFNRHVVEKWRCGRIAHQSQHTFALLHCIFYSHSL